MVSGLPGSALKVSRVSKALRPASILDKALLFSLNSTLTAEVYAAAEPRCKSRRVGERGTVREPEPSLITMLKLQVGPVELFLSEILEARVALTTFTFALNGCLACSMGSRREI